MIATAVLVGTMSVGCKETVKEKETTVMPGPVVQAPAGAPVEAGSQPAPTNQPEVTEKKSSETTTTTQSNSNLPNSSESTTTEKFTTEKSTNN